MHTPASPPTRRSILRKPKVKEVTGLSDTTIWRQIRAGQFPKPIKLSPNAVGWLESDIDRWIADRMAARDVA